MVVEISHPLEHGRGPLAARCLFVFGRLDEHRLSKLTHIVAAERHVLGDIEPERWGLSAAEGMSVMVGWGDSQGESDIPEIQIVDGSLLISHIYVEGVEVNRRQSPATQHLEERGQPAPGLLRRRGLSRRTHGRRR